MKFKNSCNNIVILSLILLSLLNLVGCGTTAEELNNGSVEELSAPSETTLAEAMYDENLKVSVLDIGSADCIVIQSGDYVIMIDTGEKSASKTILSFLSEAKIDTIDLLIITHFDKDHVGSAAKIAKSVNIAKVVQPDYGDYQKSASAYDKYIEALNEYSIPVTTLSETTSYNFGNAIFTIYPPMKSYYGDDEENDFSLVTEIKYGDTRLLFAGDAENARIKELYLQIDNLRYDFLKVPHHGVHHSENAQFFREVQADYAVICCSEKENADARTINSLKACGTKVYLTYYGTVVCESDGNSVYIVQ